MLTTKEVIEAMFDFPYYQEVEIVSLAESGASGPKVVIVFSKSENKHYVLKYGKTRVPIKTQIQNRSLLEPFLEEYLPQVIGYREFSDGEEAMKMEYAGPHNFHQIVIRSILPDAECLEIWQRVLRAVKRVWHESKRDFSGTENYPRRPKERVVRVINSLLRTVVDNSVLNENKDLLLRINNQKFPSLSDTFEILSQRTVDPSLTVFCHNDLNADNIIVDEELKWHLIDWEWVGETDWTLSLSHLIGWWISNATRQRDWPTLKVQDNHLCFSYSFHLPPIFIELIEAVYGLGKDFATEAGDSDWEQRLITHLAIFLFGEIRFLAARDRLLYFIPFLGEGVRMLSQGQELGSFLDEWKGV
ncbi:MAG: hypothetical protein AB1465_02995 [Patescibacteria group bacterium]